jgi:hypothetical protein
MQPEKVTPPVYEGSVLAPAAFAGALATFYFGPCDREDRLARYIRRAYRDMNRTIVGLGALDQRRRTALRATAEDRVRDRLLQLMDDQSAPSATGFDSWHRSACEVLIGVYRSHEVHLTVGQAQKWLNMTLKYLFVADALGVTPMAQVRPYYRFAHMPIDNVVLDALGAMEPVGPPYPRPWSRQDDYDEYLRFQRAVRERFGCCLDGEFMAWHPRCARWTPTKGSV